MTLLAGRAIAKSFGSRLILDGADLAVDAKARIGVVWDGGVRAMDGGYSAWLERRAAATG